MKCLASLLLPCCCRLVLQFKRSYKRNDKPVCTAAAKFIAHLINQGVAHEVRRMPVPQGLLFRSCVF